MPRDLLEVLTGEWPAVAGIGVAVVGVTSWVKNLFDIRKCSTEIRLIEEQISAQRIQNRAAVEKLSDERLDRELADKQKRRAELLKRREKRHKINRRLAAITPVLAIALVLPTSFIRMRTTDPITSPGGELPVTSQLAKNLGRLTESMISGQPAVDAPKIIDPAAQDALQKTVQELAARQGPKLKVHFQGRTDGDRIWLDITDDQNRAVASVVFVIRNNRAERVEVPFNDPDAGRYAK